VCSFLDGSFYSTTRKAKLVQVEEFLLESDMDRSSANTFFKIITAIAHGAGTQKHGCTIVIDLNKKPVYISGQTFSESLDLQKPEFMDLAKSFSKVDGALHIGADLKLHGFACILDGQFIPGEDRARGARFNSALRFTAEHDNIIVVVVSSDEPVSVIMEGVELSNKCEWKPVSRNIKPLLLETWVAEENIRVPVK
jgi:DNA integrity scanning protein DisA with diadenylate cyclase activity